MSKVIQIQTTTIGDNVNSEQKMITTILYDNGEVYQGGMEYVGGDYDNGYVYEMVWHKLDVPQSV